LVSQAAYLKTPAFVFATALPDTILTHLDLSVIRKPLLTLVLGSHVWKA
jgi:hypothetical protein